MTFPIVTDYKTAMRNAPDRFASLDVKPFFGENGDPVFMAGNFAAVFKATLNGDEAATAVKCFIRDLPDLEERYRAIARLNRRVEAPYLIDVAFLPRGVFVKSAIAPSGEYPVVTMPWIEGKTLGGVVERFCAKQYRKGLATLTRAWAGICLDLLGKGIAHGDLKHDNVLVTREGQLKLIDYESMFLPELKELRSVLLGGASYQHPRRDLRHFGRSLDHFSMLVITLSLRALTMDPGLHATFNTGENIILSRQDFLDPRRSEIVNLLLECPDALVRDWTDRLIKASRSDLIAVPGLERVLRRARRASAELVDGHVGSLFSFLHP